MTLLIVDDNAESRRVLRLLFHGLASDIHEASDGAAAVRACHERLPDCVLMDLRMRPMNGLAATQEIHRQWPAIPVVIVSDQDDEETHLAAAAAGAAAFFSKDHLSDLPRLLVQQLKSASSRL